MCGGGVRPRCTRKHRQRKNMRMSIIYGHSGLHTATMSSSDRAQFVVQFSRPLASTSYLESGQRNKYAARQTSQEFLDHQGYQLICTARGLDFLSTIPRDLRIGCAHAPYVSAFRTPSGRNLGNCSEPSPHGLFRSCCETCSLMVWFPRCGARPPTNTIY